ncbi:Cytokinin dehydrogenase 6 [Hibiscus syriacus]|uniref:cytokinin dehydrogenase n=1 Tax=Hibiscus syriacus TaxID=106335 RepID=A0A6A2WYY1_HIBSY|nr:cytokinin dehydrogenase 3-like [Hibiscus syriacus]KAE8666881.1 Cytokinin dehydrogenase 6 [Hibiscus syriacus]
MVAAFPSYFTVIMLLSRLMAFIGIPKNDDVLSSNLEDLDIGSKLSRGPSAIASSSQDFGLIVKSVPQAVLFPSSPQDIASLLKSNYNSSAPFTVAARGNSHSVRGQAMAKNGVVVDMTWLNKNPNKIGIRISNDGKYADVGGQQLWIDVLNVTLRSGLSPVSWTDYLYLTVGGTLSNAGISGQTFRYGPQISNVYEMDVITGKGDFVTCSPNNNSDLFFAVLGGLGQFGIITRARIPLETAPKRVKWIRMFYSDFTAFSRDQELLISKNERADKNALNYVEGSLLLNQGSLENFRSTFFPPQDQPKIIALITKYGIVYSLEIVKYYYDDQTNATVDKDLQQQLQGLTYLPGFLFEKGVSYVEFLNRVRSEELKLRSKGLWDVPHPWLNLFIPKSRMTDFNHGVFKGIVLQRKITIGPLLVYPMNRNKWDDRMSASIPDEEIFYTVGFLLASGFDNWQAFDDQNKAVLRFCEKAGIEVKQYLPHYTTKEDWITHFGSKWNAFQQRKQQFDPKFLLSPGQSIFNSNS